MRLLSSVLACAGIAAAGSFQDTSPFIFFSTSEVLASPPQISSADSLSSTISSAISKCLTDVYFIAHQPSVSAEDYAGETCTACLKTKWLSSDSRIQSSFVVAQVRGVISPASIEQQLVTDCSASATSLDASTGMVVASSDNANVTKPRVVHIELPQLPANEPQRKHAELENERLLTNMIEAHGGKSFTVLYTTTPRTTETPAELEEDFEYEMDNGQIPLNMELKRDLGRRAEGKNGSVPSNAPLFEKYQYFTPGLFMGLGAFVFLTAILYVAASAISGLQVSYGAFEKESGPQSQKKQQ